MCANRRAIPRNCPGVLHFDIRKKVCNFPSLVDCSNDKKQTYVSKIPSVLPPRKDSNEKDDSAFIPDCSSQANNVYLRDPRSCSKFYVCAYGKAIPRQCPKGLYIDTKIRYCNFPNRVDCTIETPDCSDKDYGTIIRDSKQCNKYYECQNGSPRAHFCTPGKWFDLKKGVCQQKNLVECN